MFFGNIEILLRYGVLQVSEVNDKSRVRYMISYVVYFAASMFPLSNLVTTSPKLSAFMALFPSYEALKSRLRRSLLVFSLLALMH
jgi:hypothetical protein